MQELLFNKPASGAYQDGMHLNDRLLALNTNIRARVEVNIIGKHSSSLRYCNNYGSKSFIMQILDILSEREANLSLSFSIESD
jgi:hypothetical protein